MQVLPIMVCLASAGRPKICGKCQWAKMGEGDLENRRSAASGRPQKEIRSGQPEEVHKFTSDSEVHYYD